MPGGVPARCSVSSAGAAFSFPAPLRVEVCSGLDALFPFPFFPILYLPSCCSVTTLASVSSPSDHLQQHCAPRDLLEQHPAQLT